MSFSLMLKWQLSILEMLCRLRWERQFVATSDVMLLDGEMTVFLL